MPTIQDLLIRSHDAGASDLHLTSGKPSQIRKDGSMEVFDDYVPSEGEVLSSLYSLMSDDQARLFETTRDIDFAIEIPGISRFRVHAFYLNNAPALVFHRIPTKVMTLDELGLSQVFRNICDQQSGLVVVSGPAGSGTSTTLAAMIDYINKARQDHILTLEDPIEFVHKGWNCAVTQKELDNGSASFSEAMKEALHDEPNIILLGEMRDQDTLALALTAAESGRLVLGTLHTTTAIHTLEWILGMFPTHERSMVRSMLAESIRAIVSQTLIKKSDKGQIAAHEIMIATPAIQKLIREDRLSEIPSLIESGVHLGMKTLNQAIDELISAGIVSPTE